jgi:hypothetical protein
VSAELQNTENQKDEIRYTVSSELVSEKKQQRSVHGKSQKTEDQTVTTIFNTKSEAVRTMHLRKEITWSHYSLIMRVDNPNARQYYMNEAADHNWSVRALQRNINTFYFERILSTNYKSEALIKAGLKQGQSPPTSSKTHTSSNS